MIRPWALIVSSPSGESFFAIGRLLAEQVIQTPDRAEEILLLEDPAEAEDRGHPGGRASETAREMETVPGSVEDFSRCAA